MSHLIYSCLDACKAHNQTRAVYNGQGTPYFVGADCMTPFLVAQRGFTLNHQPRVSQQGTHRQVAHVVVLDVGCAHMLNMLRGVEEHPTGGTIEGGRVGKPAYTAGSTAQDSTGW